MERLSGLDASFLYVETPTAHMHVGLVAVLDPLVTGRKYSEEQVSALIAREAQRQPRLRKKLVEVPLHLDHPRWIDDPSFDIINHLRRVACPAPGDAQELAALTGRILSTPLDRARPLWEMWIVEGLEHGQYALIAKIHHAIADGLTGASLMASMFSLAPDARPPSLPPPPPAPEPGGELPSETDLLRDAMVSRLQKSQEVVRLFKRTRKALQDIVERRASGEHRMGASPLDAPRTLWNAPLSAQRSTAFVRVPLADVKVVRKAFSAGVSDVVLALCSGAMRRYLEARGELPLAPLVAAIPVATRKKQGGFGNNHVSALFTSLATNIEDPVERLAVIRSVMRGAKEEHNTFGADMMASWAEVMSPGLFSMASRMYSKYRVAEHHRPLYNVAISTVPGPPVPLYFSGARMVASYPFGPLLDGVGLNITVMSYGDHMEFGFLTAPNVLPDIWTMANLVPEVSAELVARARRERPQPGKDKGAQEA
jgi:diacylglycerol O-acyltransferase